MPLSQIQEDTSLANTLNPQQALKRILDLIQRTNGDGDVFAQTLRRERIPHISFSQVSCVEFCPQRYYLQYVLGQDPDPLPDYFTKGKLFHSLLADFYRGNGHPSNHPPNTAGQAFADGALPHPASPNGAPSSLSPTSRTHLENAYAVHLQHSWSDCRVIAVEQPFAMLADEALPPLVGVIDLVLEHEGETIIVDHKTGRDFYPQDELQSAIYSEYLRRQFGDTPVTFYYDHYRWVENLQRIRKPALQRTPVVPSAESWPAALERIRSGYRLIEQVTRQGGTNGNGQCFRCPYRADCW